MPSLKEVKNRISTVRTTRKITQARQMISSVRLHKAQAALESARTYDESLEALLLQMAGQAPLQDYALSELREKGAVAVVIMSSNNGMCGAFNAQMEKELPNIKKRYPNNKLLFYPIGKKIRAALTSNKYNVSGSYDSIAEKAPYAEVAKMVAELMQLFLSGKVKHVEVVYHKYKTVGVQLIEHEQLLPVTLPEAAPVVDYDYILEPSAQKIMEALLPMLVKARVYAYVANNRASEHAARTIAMQLATENADDILSELQLSYNKLRQQNITAELLDIIGGSFA